MNVIVLDTISRGEKVTARIFDEEHLYLLVHNADLDSVWKCVFKQIIYVFKSSCNFRLFVILKI
jgi:hypothetical protein